MKKYSDVLAIMKERGYTPEEMLEATEQFVKAADSTHTPPEDTMSDSAKATAAYLGKVVTGKIAKKGLEDIHKDLSSISSNPEAAMKYIGPGVLSTKAISAVDKGIDKSMRMRASHNLQDRTPVPVEGVQKDMKAFLDQHDYSYFLKKDGSVSVDIYDTAGKVDRKNAKSIKDLRAILGY